MTAPVVSAAVEGIVDDAVVRKLLAHAGGEVGTGCGRPWSTCSRCGHVGAPAGDTERVWVEERLEAVAQAARAAR